MGNENNGMSLVFKIDKLLEKFRSLLGSKNRRRLIQYKDLSSSYKRLENFDLLFHSDGNIPYFGVRVNGKIVFFGKFLRDLNGLFVIYKSIAFRFHTKNHIFGHRQTWHEHEMLMHHSYSL